MEDILITDISEFEEITESKIIEESVPESLKEERKENIEDERKSDNKSDVVIYYSDVNNNLLRTKSVGVKENNVIYDEILLWENNTNVSIGSGILQLSDVISNYDAIKIEYYPNTNGLTFDSLDLSKINKVIIPSENIPTGLSNSPVIGQVVGNVQSRYFFINTGNTKDKLSQNVTSGYQSVPLKIYGLNVSNVVVPTPTPIPTPNNPSVSGNVINNYYISVSSNGVSYNLINKPLNEYTPTESMFAISILFALGVTFAILCRKAVFRWK